jgi:hypothetical protein
MAKAAVRVNKITSIAQLRGATLHAERQDETGKARVREGAVAGEALAWSKAESDRDYLTAFKSHKAETGASERKGAPIGMQVLCVISPEWIEQAGDLHDRNNPRNQQLFEHAKAWAESWAGEGSVFGVRLDLDEAGGGVVDLMIAPVRESRGKPVISTQKALTDLRKAMGERNEYSALQSSWADHCRTHLDPVIERGQRKVVTQRQHLSPETYGAVKDDARAEILAEFKARGEHPQDELSMAMALLNQPMDPAHETLLLDGVVLAVEINRHRTDPAAYKPPRGLIQPRDVHSAGGEPQTTLEALTRGATAVLKAAEGFSLGFWETLGDEAYQTSKEIITSLVDRMHLAAVVAKCTAFTHQMEALVRQTFKLEEDKASDEQLWQAQSEVRRHETALGLHPVVHAVAPKPASAEAAPQLPKVSAEWLRAHRDWTDEDRVSCKRLFEGFMSTAELAALKRGDMSAQPFLEAIIPDSNLRRGVAIEYLKADRATAYGEGVQKLALEQAASTVREQDDGFGHD